MRKLTTILAVLVMLGMCVSSFGYILVYNVSTTVNGADARIDAKATIPLKAYLVLNLANDGDLVDANLVMYGNDANTPKKQKVYVQLNYNDLLSADVWYIGDFIFVDFWSHEPFDFEILLSGKVTSKDIGLGASDKKLVASSIKGVNMVWEGFLLGPDADQNVSGTANASATLWTAAVKAINDPLEPWTQDEVVVTGKDLTGGHQNSLIEMLEAKKFNAAELP